MSRRRPWSQESRLARSRPRSQVLKLGKARFNIGNVRALAALVLAPAFALGAVAGAAGIVGGVDTPPTKPDGIVWANRVFASQDDLQKWLTGRGADYETWASRHPDIAAVFAKGGQPAHTAEAKAATESSSGARDGALIVILVAGTALGLLLLVYALEPRLTVLASRRPALPRPKMQLQVPALATHLPSRSTVLSRAPGVVRHPETVVMTLRHAFRSRRLRRSLPTIAFYAISVILALVLGASVAIYFQ
jgi:hypothetical protein